MINVIDKEKCCGCQACVSVCPKKCILLKEDSEGFLYPLVNLDLCIKCNACESVCLFLKNEPLRTKKPICYAAKTKNDALRISSSSGGVFSELALSVLSNNGIVYGVSFADDLKSAKHIRIEKKEELPKIMGSKYIQSSVTGIFYSVKQDLDKGKYVLFSGVPCQIDGLKLFLRKPYINLICVDLICHGIPSPKLWRQYFDFTEAKFNATITGVNFRDKTNGWKEFGIKKEGKNTTQLLSQNDDPFMFLFLKNYSLRPSCYACNAKKIESMSDITLADFWGVERVAPEFDDNKGVSLVLIHSEKGNNALESLKDKLNLIKVPFEESLKDNPSYFCSSKKPESRDCFFEDMNKTTFKELKAKYCKLSIKSKVKHVIKKSFIWKLLKRLSHHRGGHKNNNEFFTYGLSFKMTKKD